MPSQSLGGVGPGEERGLVGSTLGSPGDSHSDVCGEDSSFGHDRFRCRFENTQDARVESSHRILPGIL